MNKSILLFLLFPILSHADVYKCVEKSKVIYSGVPCSKDSTKLETDSLTVTPSAFSVGYSPAGGGYVVPVIINGLTVNGVLDTGATDTTVSGVVAYRLGIKTCQFVGSVNTAAGKVDVCRLTNIRLSFGGFVFGPVSVQVIPSMSHEMLIGQDILSRLQVVQKNGVMTLSK